MSSKIEILTGGGGTLCGLYNRPVESSAKAGRKAHTLVVMAHGFPGGHKGGQGDLYGEMQFLLAEHGLHSLRFDFRGCGESTGFPERFTLASAQEDLKHVVLWAKGRGYKEIAYVGEGLGASACLLSLDLNVRALALLWPTVDLRAHAAWLADEGGATDADKENGYFTYGGSRIGLPLIVELRDSSLLGGMRDAFMPVLVLQGMMDKAAPADRLPILKNHMASRGLEISTFHDGVHGLGAPAHRKAVLQQVKDFLGKNI